VKWALLVVALAAYEFSPLLNAGFVYEDARWLEASDGMTVSMADLTLQRAPRLLTRYSFSWQRRAGHSPLAFHALNLALHVIVCALVALLVSEVSSLAVGLCAASLFLLYPLNMEAVGYVSGRADLIAAIGVLCACLCGLRGQWIGVLFGLGLGVLGKESAIVGLPLVALVRAMAYGRKSDYVASGVLASAVMAAAWFVAPSEAVWTPTWAGLQMAAWVRHVAQTVIPIGSSVDFNYRALPVSVLAIAAVFTAGLSELAWRWRWSAPLLAGGLAWMLIAAMPRFVAVTPHSLLNEHQFYVPRIGAAIMVAHVFRVKPCLA
jgi:hypothetical protein